MKWRMKIHTVVADSPTDSAEIVDNDLGNPDDADVNESGDQVADENGGEQTDTESSDD